jgi:hypothetical protein
LVKPTCALPRHCLGCSSEAARLQPTMPWQPQTSDLGRYALWHGSSPSPASYIACARPAPLVSLVGGVRETSSCCCHRRSCRAMMGKGGPRRPRDVPASSALLRRRGHRARWLREGGDVGVRTRQHEVFPPAAALSRQHARPAPVCSPSMISLPRTRGCSSTSDLAPNCLVSQA